MKDKPSITYIKNGKEKTSPLNKITEKLIFKKLADKVVYQSNGKKTISKSIFPSVTFIHIKNYTFKKNLKILNDLENQNLTIILENCTFEDSLCFNSIKNLTILNPNFIKEQKIYI